MNRILLSLAAFALFSMPIIAQGADATWVQASQDGGFPGRDTARIVKFKNRILMSGGYRNGGVAFRDLYFSGDGAHWTLAQSATPYPVYTPIAVHRGKIVAVAADGVRSTTDLVHYSKILDQIPFADSLVEAPLIGDFNHKLWLILGDKIRYSDDGSQWSVASTPWKGKLANFSAIKHDGYIYVFGGAFDVADVLPESGYDTKTMANKVWRTADPINGPWEEFTPPWGARLWPQAVSHNGSIYVIAGYSNIAAKNYDDVWKCSTDMRCQRLSTDAIYRDPTESPSGVSYPPRHWPAVFSFNGAVWMCGGNRNPDGPGTVNDCWYLREN